MAKNRNFFEASWLKHINSDGDGRRLDFSEMMNMTSWKHDGETGDGIRVGLDLLGQYALHSYVLAIEHIFDRCESPIERAMLLAISIIGLEDEFPVIFIEHGSQNGIFRYQCGGIFIEPQAEVAGFRVDFLITRVESNPDFDNLVASSAGTMIPGIKEMRKSLIVECDGHEFHEKTKEQAKRDKRRDREFAKAKIPVFHYTGSEIWADVFKCAREVNEQLYIDW